MKNPRRIQHKYAKPQYRIRDWPEYGAGLWNRGDMTVWLSDAALTIRMIFHLPLRQTEGFLRSLAGLLGLGFPILDHTTPSRRLKRLGNLLFLRLAKTGPIHLLIDSTGLRTHVGHLRQPPVRRVWRKLHLGDPKRKGEAAG